MGAYERRERKGRETGVLREGSDREMPSANFLYILMG